MKHTVIIMRRGHETYTHDGVHFAEIKAQVDALLGKGWKLYIPGNKPGEYDEVKTFDPGADELLVVPRHVGG